MLLWSLWTNVDDVAKFSFICLVCLWNVTRPLLCEQWQQVEFYFKHVSWCEVTKKVADDFRKVLLVKLSVDFPDCSCAEIGFYLRLEAMFFRIRSGSHLISDNDGTFTFTLKTTPFWALFISSDIDNNRYFHPSSNEKEHVLWEWH